MNTTRISARFVAHRILTIALLAVPAGRCRAADPRDDLLADYQRPAAALLEHYRAVRVTYHFREPAGPQHSRLTRATTVVSGLENYRCAGEVQKLDAAGNPAGPAVKTLTVRNQRYEFDLREPGENRYVLGGVTTHADQPRPWGTVLFPVADPWRRRTYLDILQHPDTAVHAVRREVWRGRPVVTADVEYAFAADAATPPSRFRTLYRFDPAAGWACVGESSIPSDPADRTQYESVYTYATRDGWPAPTREELWERNVSDPGPGKLLRASDIDEFVPIPPPGEAEFRLTAFGLPEPAGVEWPKPSPRWLWLVAGVGGFLASAVLFGWLARRTATARRPEAVT